jgi:hypothetical protein
MIRTYPTHCRRALSFLGGAMGFFQLAAGHQRKSARLLIGPKRSSAACTLGDGRGSFYQGCYL